MSPRFSIVLPTFNRRDTVVRAITSVRAQSFGDWELIVVDDGSSDGTRDVVAGLDARVRLISQENQGVAGARNAGLRNANGRLIAFLDSDDEWPPYHLALAEAFLRAHPREHVYTSEVWQDWGPGRRRNLTLENARDSWPALGKRIGSPRFRAPPPEDDPYLYYYATRGGVGTWGEEIVATAGHPCAAHYRGQVFESWRWGWMAFLQPTVITRHAMEAVGPFDTRYRIASDYGYLALLARLFETNLVSVPGCLKHELDAGRRPLSEDHLVYGAKTAIAFREDALRQFEALHWSANQADPELNALRGQYRFFLAQAALLHGRLDLARVEAHAAAHTFGGLEPAVLQLVARCPHAGVARRLYAGWMRSRSLPQRARARWRRVLRQGG